ncbi:MAG: hypothetical protein ACHQSE_07555 [Gemmatimonadales bacterium]
MHKFIPLLIAASVVSGSAPASGANAGSPYATMAPLARYLAANPADEIALARSAAPASISDSATILVLGKAGYETAVKGTNGFACFVQRSWAQDFDNAQFWNPKIHTPQCWNAAAVRSVLPSYLKRTGWALAKVSKEEMAKRTTAAWAAHEFTAPAPGSMAYMLSKDQYIQDPQPGSEARWYPHVMFFMPASEEGKWGANEHGSPMFSATSSSEPVTTFFVIVPKWSDGSVYPYPAPAAGSHHHE